MLNTLAAIPFIDIDVPLPLIDLDRISEIVGNTYDCISTTYTDKHFEDSILNQPLEAFVRHLKKQHKYQTPSILDIGCGPGWEAKFLVARGFRVVGIDVSHEMVKKADQYVPKGKFCQFYQMKMQDLQFQQATFDAIWSARTLIHVPKVLVVDLLASWKRVLKPEGVLGISVIIGERRGWQPEEYDPKLPMFNRYFAENELNEALETAGFSILESQIMEDRGEPDSPYNLFIFAQRADSRLNLEHYSQYLYETMENKERGIVNQDYLEQIIAEHLHTGLLSNREQVNLCVLYDQLAQRDKANKDQYKLAAQKLKLHLLTPATLVSQDFSIWFTLGQLHLKITQFQHAVTCLEQARRLQPDHFATLVRLGYSYEGLGEFDKAVNIAHEAENLAESCQVDNNEMADLYHALGHFYVSRSHIGHAEMSVSDRETGERYMEKACSTGEKGYGYLSCLGSIYNETKRYTETIRLLEEAMSIKRVQEYEDLYNELYFYHGEACMGADRYENAKADFDRVERYARTKQDWDALAHVKLYQVRTSLKSKDVSELQLQEIRDYLIMLYQHEPSPYVVKSFQQDRERLISILSAFYLLKQCLDEQEPPIDFNERLALAINYMEKVLDTDQKTDLGLLVLADNPGAVPGELWRFDGSPHLYGFDEVETDLTERELKRYRVWGILVLEKYSEPPSLAHITFLIGRFYREGYTIYVYDPHIVFPEIVHKSLENFFVDSIDDLKQFSYMNLLYDKAREYLSSTRTPLGMAPIGVAPSLIASQAEDIFLLPLDEGDKE